LSFSYSVAPTTTAAPGTTTPGTLLHHLQSSLDRIVHFIAEGTEAPTTTAATTTTAAPVTTTTAAIAEETCTLREGMKNERTILPGWLKSDPATDNVDSLRPNKDATWTVDSEDSPAILITVSEKEAIPVGSVEITSDVQEITVFYTSSVDEPFKPVTEKRSTEPKVGLQSGAPITLLVVNYINAACYQFSAFSSMIVCLVCMDVSLPSTSYMV
jgi:hypothetical protein